MLELLRNGFSAESQKPITIQYEGHNVGELVADIIVNDNIILELKSIRQISRIHEAQLVNYLVATGKPVGLLVNFGEFKVEVRRKLRELKRIEKE
jgi:GxxExxY protein